MLLIWSAKLKSLGKTLWGSSDLDTPLLLDSKRWKQNTVTSTLCNVFIPYNFHFLSPSRKYLAVKKYLSEILKKYLSVIMLFKRLILSGIYSTKTAHVRLSFIWWEITIWPWTWTFTNCSFPTNKCVISSSCWIKEFFETFWKVKVDYNMGAFWMCLSWKQFWP